VIFNDFDIAVFIDPFILFLFFHLLKFINKQKLIKLKLLSFRTGFYQKLSISESRYTGEVSFSSGFPHSESYTRGDQITSDIKLTNLPI